MVTLVDVMKAINLKIRENFPNIPIRSTDISEGFQRPCFYVEFSNVKTTPLNDNNVCRDFNATIFYFPKDAQKYQLDIMNVQDVLEMNFLGRLKIKERFSTMIEDIDSDVNDGVLETSFPISYVELKPNTDEFDIEELYFENQKIEQ